MQYNAPPGSLDPNAPFLNGIPGQVKGSPVNAHALEYPQREILNVITAANLTPTNNEMDQLLMAIEALIQRRIPNVPKQYDISDTLEYFLCWHPFRGIHPTAKAGMVPVNGTLISDAAMRYPQAFAYLQTAEGQQLCTTETLWQASNTAVWATLADGTKVGWDGIGGVCKYVIDTNAGTIRVPDLRGMTDEVAGFDSLGVGGVHGDALPRALVGNANGAATGFGSGGSPSGGGLMSGTNDGAFRATTYSIQCVQGAGASFWVNNFDPSRVVAVANKNQVRAYGSLACVYLGQPAS